MKNPNSLENRNRIQNREIAVLAHNIRSTHNIGAILRTCEGFGVSKIIFSGYSPFPILPDENFKKTNRLPHIAQKLDSQIHKTALGAEKIVPAEISDNILDTIQNLKKQNFEIFALEQSKKSIFLKDFSAPKNAKIALLLGEEVDGISEKLIDLCDKTLEIPMFGKKESFNVSVATGIALYKIACE